MDESGKTMTRETNLLLLRELIRNREADSAVLETALSKATDAEIDVIATAVRDDPDNFVPIFIRDGTARRSLRWVASSAIIYDKRYFSEVPNPQFLTAFLNTSLHLAYKYLHGIDEIDEKAEEEKGNWRLQDEDTGTQARARRFTSLAYVVYSKTKKMPSRELLERALDDTRTDYEDTMRILIATPTATAAQIDYLLSGGPPPLSSGSL